MTFQNHSDPVAVLLYCGTFHRRLATPVKTLTGNISFPTNKLLVILFDGDLTTFCCSFVKNPSLLPVNSRRFASLSSRYSQTSRSKSVVPNFSFVQVRRSALSRASRLGVSQPAFETYSSLAWPSSLFGSAALSSRLLAVPKM